MKEKFYVVTRVWREDNLDELHCFISGVFHNLGDALDCIDEEVKATRQVYAGDDERNDDYVVSRLDFRHETIWDGYGTEQHWYVDELSVEVKVNLTEEVWNGRAKKKESGSPAEESFGEGQASGAAGTAEE